MSAFRENHCREDLFPLTLTRHTADLRVGIFSNSERWELAIRVYPSLSDVTDIPANVIPNVDLFAHVAARGTWIDGETEHSRTFHYPWELPGHNAWAIKEDLRLLAMTTASGPIPASNRIIGDAGAVFLEEGCRVEHCYINTLEGPVHIGKNALVMEGSMIRGPVSIGEGAVVKMGTAIYGATTIGPGSVIGGEVKNSIFFEHTNKAHHGYIGDAVIGAWCNLGAGTSCSNLRNNASPVKVWHMRNKAYMEAGLKCGLIMGDYSRCAINTSFNTGTVTGVSVNLFQSGQLLPKYIPSFSWGVDTGIRYDLDKAISDINNWMEFKGRSLSPLQIDQLKDIYSNTDHL